MLSCVEEPQVSGVWYGEWKLNKARMRMGYSFEFCQCGCGFSHSGDLDRSQDVCVVFSC